MAGDKGYIAAHNGLRGVAALLVVFYHLQFGADYRLNFETATRFFQKSYLMVDLFFILSGFIISFTAMPDGRKMTGTESKEFFRSRIARIYPLHLFCLLYVAAYFSFLALYSLSRGEAIHPARWSGTGLLSFLRELFLVQAWGAAHAPTWNIPSWSISAEILAYLLFPLLVGLFLRKCLTVALSLLAAAFFIYIGATTGNLDIVSVLSGLRCLSGFVFGMLIYKYRASSGHISDRALSIFQTAAVIGIFAILASGSNDVYVTPCFVLLVWATWQDKGLIAKLLAVRPLQFLGKISYSVYLNHYCLIQILFFFWSRLVADRPISEPWVMRFLWIALVVSVVLAISAATFRWIEQPGRRFILSHTKSREPSIS